MDKSEILHLWRESIKNYDKKKGRAEINRWRKMHENGISLEEAIGRAAESKRENRKPYPHQGKTWNFWPDSVPQAMGVLPKAADQFKACTNFEGILECVESLVSGFEGLKEMYCYDVAVRIGAFIGTPYLPTKVYLHAGALAGAKRLGLATDDRGFVEMSELPEYELLKEYGLEPYDAENILCHFNKRCRAEERERAQA